MSYKNKTYIIFDADNDMKYYRLMTAWKENNSIDFNFHNAHDLNNLRDGSLEDTIKRKLRERMINTKQVLVLVGDNTKFLYKFVRWEIDIAISMDIPIIAVNLNKINGSHKMTPPILKKTSYFLSVPFELHKIKYSLDNFPTNYLKNKHKAPSAQIYRRNN
ncbi:TIR domain-containing protein [Poseidonibacter lekithochrous]|uniref:TIR domain-containing protein n=1 Tax=Poseidonibacter TaxID=2321187 RepID=UPI001C081895|nr:MULTISPECIES: TIR domain-containing protein [Poseidonibacter]MBU3015660.1 TIR domain-containing protein [Poseidonibacter lekithochrous]MDO6828961.1 TIR domain-containing protein [Poseidonibacter sp. 1_MG-2023]